MKRIIAIIPFDALENVRAALVALDIGGMMLSKVYAQGLTSFRDDGAWILEEEVYVRLELMTPKEHAADLVDAILAWVRESSKRPSGIILELPIEEVVRIRTLESGAAAL